MMKFTAASFEVYSQETEVGFDPPLSHLASCPASFEFYWKMIQYVFGLPDPNALRPVSNPDFGDDTLIRLRRYCSAARELASGEFVCSSGGFKVSFGPEGESIQADFGSKELLRGFSVLFRQFYSDSEPASFSGVRGLLWQLAASDETEVGDALREFLSSIHRAEKRLRRRTINVEVGKKAIVRGQMGGSAVPLESLPEPERLISAFFYGDLIHFGDKAEVLSLYSDCDFSDANHRLALGQSLLGLAHVYMCLAVAIEALLPDLRS